MGELNMVRTDGFSCLNNKPAQVRVLSLVEKHILYKKSNIATSSVSVQLVQSHNNRFQKYLRFSSDLLL